MVGSITAPILNQIRLPKTHWQCRFDQIPDSCSHKKAVKDWLDNIPARVTEPRGLLLYGDYSQGKSGTASICLKAAAAHGILGMWVTARELPKHVIEKTVFDEQWSFIERAEYVPLLVIDEVQIRKNVAYSEQAVEALIRRRIDDEKCTIITTNHSKDDFQKSYPALFAALTEAVYPIWVGGHNFRQNISKDW